LVCAAAQASKPEVKLLLSHAGSAPVVSVLDCVKQPGGASVLIISRAAADALHYDLVLIIMKPYSPEVAEHVVGVQRPGFDAMTGDSYRGLVIEAGCVIVRILEEASMASDDPRETWRQYSLATGAELPETTRPRIATEVDGAHILSLWSVVPVDATQLRALAWLSRDGDGHVGLAVQVTDRSGNELWKSNFPDCVSRSCNDRDLSAVLSRIANGGCVTVESQLGSVRFAFRGSRQILTLTVPRDATEHAPGKIGVQATWTDS
jgi:hypothetical protein